MVLVSVDNHDGGENVKVKQVLQNAETIDMHVNADMYIDVHLRSYTRRLHHLARLLKLRTDTKQVDCR